MVWSLIDAALQVLAAYVLADLLTGLYHFATDRGWNFRWIVELFDDHHRTNAMQGFDWQPMQVGVPGMVLGLWLAWQELPGASFVLALASFGCLSQIPHYYAHRRAKSLAICWLQRTGIIISPKHHAGHHRGRFDRNFCILSGWNNCWLNWLTRTTENQE